MRLIAGVAQSRDGKFATILVMDGDPFFIGQSESRENAINRADKMNATLVKLADLDGFSPSIDAKMENLAHHTATVRRAVGRGALHTFTTMVAAVGRIGMCATGDVKDEDHHGLFDAFLLLTLESRILLHQLGFDHRRVIEQGLRALDKVLPLMVAESGVPDPGSDPDSDPDSLN